MHSKMALRELRDVMLKEKGEDRYVNTIYGRTARYICDVLTLESDPDEVHKKIKEAAKNSEFIWSGPNIWVDALRDTDYTLAYDIIFGDIDFAPLHINDALASVAAWRLKQG